MKLKLDENGNAILRDGKPVYENAAGEEVVYDAAATAATIARLNTEAKNHRIAKEKAEEALKSFEGLDAETARKAVDVVKNLDDKKLVDAGKVDEIKRELNTAWEAKLRDKDTVIGGLNDQLRGEKIGGSFSRSKFVGDRLAIPADMVEAKFGKHFKLEEGQVRAYDVNGNLIYSKANGGEPASFDEALETIIQNYQHRDSILKADQQPGGGAKPGDPKAAARTITRQVFDSKNPVDQRKFLADGGKLTD